MTDTSEENILEMLNNIFTTCDLDGNGVVDINTLVNFLTHQDPAWQNDKKIEEEFCKVLCANESTQSISRDHFISSLLSNMKSKNQLKEESNNYDETSTQDSPGSRQPTNDNRSQEMVPVGIANNINSINNTEVHFVADGLTLTSEDVADEVSVSDWESPPVNKQLVKSLQEEIHALHRKTEYLESANNSLICQIMSLEEAITKNEKESAADLKKLLASHQLLEMQKQKQEEVEERLCLFVDDNKSVTIQLSQSERENSRLKEFIAQMEKQIELISSEKLFQDTKLKDIKGKYTALNDLFTKSQVELDSLKMKNKTGEESIEQLLDQNTNLKMQLESSDFLVQDLKSQLAATFRELSTLQNEKIKSKLQSSNLSENLSSDNSVIFFDGNFSLDSTIPFEQSLLAELQEKKMCSCDCKRDLTFTTSSPVSSEKCHLLKSDVAVGTDEKIVVHQATMTALQRIFADNSFELNNMLCPMKPKRSLTKWCVLGSILLLLCFLLGFCSSLSAISISFKHPSKPVSCLFSLLDLCQVSKKHPDEKRNRAVQCLNYVMLKLHYISVDIICMVQCIILYSLLMVKALLKLNQPVVEQ